MDPSVRVCVSMWLLPTIYEAHPCTAMKWQACLVLLYVDAPPHFMGPEPDESFGKALLLSGGPFCGLSQTGE